MSGEEDLKKFSANFQQNWQSIRPDYVINYGEEGKVIIEVKAISNNGTVGSGEIEKRALGILNLLGLGNTKYTACKFHYIPELSYFDKERKIFEAAVGFDNNNDISHFIGFEAIVCEECFKNPSMPIGVRVIFKKFKDYRKKQWAASSLKEFREQVRSATIRVNNKLKKEYGLDDDVLIYSSASAVVIINKKYFY